jgi:hypothetical protein
VLWSTLPCPLAPPLRSSAAVPAAAPQELLHPERVRPAGEPALNDGVPRPTAVLASTVEDVITLKVHRWWWRWWWREPAMTCTLASSYRS